MRIGIDCRLAGTQHAGIGRYVQNLLTHLLPNSQHDWVLLFYDQGQANQVLGDLTNLAEVELIYAPVQHYTVAEQLRLPIYLYQAKLDLLHVPHFNVPILYRKPFVVTIHDLLWHHHRGSEATTLSRLQYWTKYLFYRLIVRNAINRAKQVIVPAQTIKQTVTEYFAGATTKTTVTQEGIDENLLTNSDQQPERDNNTLLYVGSLYPHKNVRLVISSLLKLPDYTLEIVGSRSVFTKQTEEFAASLSLKNRVKFLGYLSDEELQQKYQTVTALVQPSLSEGFGLTGVEAMALGTPLLASDIPIFREIFAEGAIFFDPLKVNSFVDAVKKLETTNKTKLKEKAKAVAAQYSWQKMAEQTLDIYEQTNQ